MATQDPKRALPCPDDCAVFSDRQNKVLTTRRLVPAVLTNQGTDRQLIKSDTRDQDQAGQQNQLAKIHDSTLPTF